MTKEEMKNKCTERAKIFQQAMESCKSSSPIDCIEWFADRIAELEETNADLKQSLDWANERESEDVKRIEELEKENAELKEQCSILADCNSCTSSCKTENLEMKKQLSKAKEILQRLMENQPTPSSMYAEIDLVGWREVNKEAEQFLSEVEK